LCFLTLYILYRVHLQLFSSAATRRAVGSHAMNAESSRSHLCCTLTVRQPGPVTAAAAGAGAEAGVMSSKFHLVDLAGSEMVPCCRNAVIHSVTSNIIL
jgi:hypothetical protein